MIIDFLLFLEKLDILASYIFQCLKIVYIAYTVLFYFGTWICSLKSMKDDNSYKSPLTIIFMCFCFIIIYYFYFIIIFVCVCTQTHVFCLTGHFWVCTQTRVFLLNRSFLSKGLFAVVTDKLSFCCFSWIIQLFLKYYIVVFTMT